MRQRYSETWPQFSEAFLLLENADKITDEETALLFDKLTYSIFCIAIMPQSKSSTLMLESLSRLHLSTKNIEGDWFFAPDVHEFINNVYALMKLQFPLKAGIKKIGKVLREQLSKDPFRTGLELGVFI